MNNSKTNPQDVINNVYDLQATPIGELEHFDLSAVKVYTHFPDKYTVENYGKFDIQHFQVAPDERYNLIICETDFANNEKLFEAMQDAERPDVKEYELIEQNKPLHGYFLYKLIPYTVQGKPVWS